MTVKKEKVELTELTMVAKLGEKLSNIAKEIGQLQQDGKNLHSRYGYISYEQMNAALKPLLVKEKVSIVPEINKSSENIFAVKGKDGFEKSWTRTTVEMNFSIIDTETGYTMVVNWAGADQDTGGKSMAQAITETTKRFLFKLFFVSSLEDIDPDSRTTQNPSPEEISEGERAVKKQNCIKEIVRLAEQKQLDADKFIKTMAEKMNLIVAELDLESYIKIYKEIRSMKTEDGEEDEL